MARISRIGKCIACQQMTKLSDDACDKCMVSFGVTDSKLLCMMRSDPHFVRYILSRLEKPESKKFIIDKFGDPEIVLETKSND